MLKRTSKESRSTTSSTTTRTRPSHKRDRRYVTKLCAKNMRGLLLPLMGIAIILYHQRRTFNPSIYFDHYKSVGSMSLENNHRKLTGSYDNCTMSDIQSSSTYSSPSTGSSDHDHPDSGFVIASCHKIHYRIMSESFIQSGKIIVGVLSLASDRSMRDAIRKTWANNTNGVFFLVAGPWDKIQDEYESEKDLLWIDQEEVYDGQKSVLTLKSLTFIQVVHDFKERYPESHIEYALKTDDDSYVNMKALEHDILLKNNPAYYGICTPTCMKVNRDTSCKWHLTKEYYPQDYFPLYCQGAGYLLSLDTIQCMANGDSSSHVANVRFMPYEDAATGFLAERCNIQTTDATQHLVLQRYPKKFRGKGSDGTGCLKHGEQIIQDPRNAQPVCMDGKMLQHRIIDAEDMENHHKTVLDPSYCKTMEKKHKRGIIELRNENRLRNKKRLRNKLL